MRALQVLELQVALERSKDGYEETLTRLRADKAEREVKLLQVRVAHHLSGDALAIIIITIITTTIVIVWV